MNVPDPAGRAQLVAAARALQPQPLPRRRERRGRRRLRPAVIAGFVVVDVVVGSLAWHFVRGHQDSPVTAVTRLATLAGQGNWSGVYDHLCTADRRQMSAADVATGGSDALQLVHGLARVRVTDTRAVRVHLVGPVSLPAEQVSGIVVPRLGPPSAFHVTTVREVTGWKVCLSVGGYGASAFGVDAPLAS